MAAGDYVPAATTGKRTAFHVLSARAEFSGTLHGKAGTKRFWRHVETLRAMRHIEESGYYRNSDRHTVRTLVLSEN
jgi:hypothetical protein